jgi:hypothetical protein
MACGAANVLPHSAASVLLVLNVVFITYLFLLTR